MIKQNDQNSPVRILAGTQNQLKDLEIKAGLASSALERKQEYNDQFHLYSVKLEEAVAELSEDLAKVRTLIDAYTKSHNEFWRMIKYD